MPTSPRSHRSSPPSARMPDRQLAAALAASAASAAATRPAPSMRATLAADQAQRWRWVLHPASVDLYADRPGGHAVLLSSGGALHHARIALAASGRAARVELLPDADPAHLAILTAPEEIAVTPEAVARYEALGGGDGDGSRTDGPGPDDLGELTAAAAAEGVRLLVLDRDQVTSLAAATSLAPPTRERIAARTD